MRTREKLSWAIAVVLGLYAAGGMAETISGGALDPPGPPASSLRSLDEVLSAWNVKLASDDGEPCSSSRFSCIWDDQAVLDRETGLVWERTVQTSLVPYGNANVFCLASFTGGRMGWRLPTTSELTSLIDPQGSDAPYMPADHPFMNVQSASPYWTDTLSVNVITQSRERGLVWFDLSLGTAEETGFDARYWCVRGGRTEGG